MILDLGESVFPEPEPQSTTDHTTRVVESQQPPTNESPAAATTTEESTSKGDEKPGLQTVTTLERKPLKVPESVHVRITPENLKDYVGPQIYQKDRMYVHPPPPGVSTGLGYLGNGSGAVMPVEASVSFCGLCLVNVF